MVALIDVFSSCSIINSPFSVAPGPYTRISMGYPDYYYSISSLRGRFIQDLVVRPNIWTFITPAVQDQLYLILSTGQIKDVML